jgi:RNA polymerase sigma factor (sigma-70 family)
MPDDNELLRQYAEAGYEGAFAQLVSRHLPLVYSAALRQVGGDEQLAKDVAQTVFTDLARKAASLSRREVLTGWLYTSTRFAAGKAVRAERRRRQRERAAVAMQPETISTNDAQWNEVSPVLDEAMAQLAATDRNAVLLRYFEGKDLKVVGATFGISEDAARMRVNRALEKLRATLSRRKVNCTVASLAAAVAAQAVQAAPAGLAVSVSITALSAAATTTVGISTFFHIMASTKLKLGIATIVAAGVTTPLLMQHVALNRLRAENLGLREQVASASHEISQPIVTKTAQPEPFRDQAELLRLRGQVALLRKERDELSQKVASIATKTNTSRAGARAEGQVDTPWVQQVLAGPPAVQGSIAGALRGKGLRGEMHAITASEVAVREALMERQLNNTLERSPADFADFQTAFIQAAVGINDPAKVEQIRQIIRQTYEQAVALGLDIPSKPVTDTEAWVQARWQLDHSNTKAVKDLLTPEERKLFGRGFIGIMGVDLGRTGADKSNYPRGVVGP